MSRHWRVGGGTGTEIYSGTLSPSATLHLAILSNYALYGKICPQLQFLIKQFSPSKFSLPLLILSRGALAHLRPLHIPSAHCTDHMFCQNKKETSRIRDVKGLYFPNFSPLFGYPTELKLPIMSHVSKIMWTTHNFSQSKMILFWMYDYLKYVGLVAAFDADWICSKTWRYCSRCTRSTLYPQSFKDFAIWVRFGAGRWFWFDRRVSCG